MGVNRLAKAADNWSTGVARSGPSWTDGVNSVTESPTQGTLRAKEKMIQGFQKSMGDGSFEAGCNRVTAASWKQSCANKQGNFTQAAQTKKPKYAAYIQAASSTIENIRQQARAMPGDTIDQRLERANFVAREMAKNRGKFRAS